MVSYKLLNRVPVGESFHRSGWPYSMRHLFKLQDAKHGIQLDDFVEQTFLYRGKQRVAGYRWPWIGIFHHPPNAPDWFWDTQRLQYLMCQPSFMDSLPFLRGIIILSQYLADYMPRLFSGIPIRVVKHPCDRHVEQWSLAKQQVKPRLLNFGWYLRDTQILTRIPDTGFDKIRLWPGAKNQKMYDELVQRHHGVGKYGMGEEMKYVPNDLFDYLLTSSVPVCGFMDCSAANGVLDCIARAAPVIVNRHDAVEEYLGKEYPLYYDQYSDISELVKRAKDGHDYLMEMDRSWLDGEFFAETVLQAVREMVG